MQIQTSQIRAFRGSLIKLSLMSVGGILTTALSALIAAGWHPRAQPTSSGEILGYVGVLFFGSATYLTLKRLASIRSPILTLTPDGFFDVRISTAPISWSVVDDVTTWKRFGQKLVALRIAGPEIDRLPLTRIAKWNLGINRTLGAGELHLGAHDLPLGHRELLELCIAYVAAARGAHASQAKVR